MTNPTRPYASLIAASVTTFALAACGPSPSPEPAPTQTTASSGSARTTEPAPATTSTTTTTASRADAGVSTAADAATTNNDLEVRGQSSGQIEFQVEGASDLPPNIPSTMQPYFRIVDAAVAPIRAAMAECLRPLGVPARRFYRITVLRNGRMIPRPPQAITLPNDVATCAEALVRQTVVNPPPPMEIPYDIFVQIRP